MVPIIALIGRPNVGKSTLFNRLTRTHDALVSSSSGLTRDRKYGRFEEEGYEFVCIDTAGIDFTEKSVKTDVIKKSLLAVEEADIVFFIVDASIGLIPSDFEIAKYLRSCSKRILLIINKIDSIGTNSSIVDFYSLGFNDIYPISSSKKKGIRSLLRVILFLFVYKEKSFFVDPENISKLKKYKKNEIEEIKETEGAAYNSLSKNKPIKLAVVGRPNAGKSTIINYILGKERMVVCDTPGTTRDSICIPTYFNGREYFLIDTAGIRKRRKITEKIEKFSVARTFKEIKDANVVMLVIDACIGVADQDLSILEFILKSGRSFVVVINKWDAVSRIKRKQIKKNLYYRLGFISFAKVNFISALHGEGINSLFESVCKTYDNSIQYVSSRILTRVMTEAVVEHKPPLVQGSRVKMKYARSGGYNPFTVVIYGNKVKNLQNSYKNYLINYFRKALKIIGSPIRIQFRETTNFFFSKKRVNHFSSR